MLMSADFDRAHSCFLIATQPLDDGRTQCEGIVFVRRSRSVLLRVLWQPLSLMVRRWLTYGFVADEARNLREVRYNPASLGHNDKEMVEFFRWVASLPQAAPTATQSKNNGGDFEKSDRSSSAPVGSSHVNVVTDTASER